MNLETLSKAYTACVDLEERLRSHSPELADDAAILRADLHSLLMESLRAAHIPFTDRTEAAHIAFAISQGKRKIA